MKDYTEEAKELADFCHGAIEGAAEPEAYEAAEAALRDAHADGYARAIEDAAKRCRDLRSEGKELPIGPRRQGIVDSATELELRIRALQPKEGE